MVDSDTPTEQCPRTDATNVSSCEETNQCTEEPVVRTSVSQLHFSVVEGPIKSLITLSPSIKKIWIVFLLLRQLKILLARMGSKMTIP